jgi:glycosyltransferase 2 family protein
MPKLNPILKKYLIIFKIILTIILFYFIITKLDFGQLKTALLQANVLLVAAAFIVIILCFVISAYKWQVLLNIHGIYFKYSNLLSYYLIGFFFNNFLPTNIGGDAYRLFKTYNNPSSKEGAVVAIFTERLTGILMLLFIGMVGGVLSFIGHQSEISLSYIKWFGYITAAGILLLALIVFNYKRIRALLYKHLPKKIILFLEHGIDYLKNPKQLILVILISLVFQGLVILIRYLLIIAVGSDISISDLALVTALATVVALIPITINGLGLMDGAYIYLLNNFGVQVEHAALVMVFFRALNLILSLVGGLFYLKIKNEAAPDEVYLKDITS